MVPKNLRRWFVLHFIIDILFAIPLMIIPDQFLTLVMWEPIDTLAARIVGAALLGIGFGGFLSKDEEIEAYRAMLNIKIIWSLSAILGIVLTMLRGAPVFAWLMLLLFVIFGIVWMRYRVLLGLRIKAKD